MQALQVRADPTNSTRHEVVIQSMQKDFESRVDRYRDEVQYLRQKCDEKDRRYENLLAEKGSLAAELRSQGIGDVWGGGSVSSDVEAGSKLCVGGSRARRSTIRTLLPTTPMWLQSADEPFRIVLRALMAYPQVRLGFFGYIIVLHIWVLFILQHAMWHAAGKAPDPGSSSP